MSLMRYTRLAVAVLALLLGCKDQSPVPSLAGRWLAVMDTGLRFDLSLAQGGSTVAGDGLVGVTGDMDPATVTGTYLAPQVSLTITRPGQATFNVTGEHAGNQITGVLNGGLAEDRPITFTRQ